MWYFWKKQRLHPTNMIRYSYINLIIIYYPIIHVEICHMIEIHSTDEVFFERSGFRWRGWTSVQKLKSFFMTLEMYKCGHFLSEAHATGVLVETESPATGTAVVIHCFVFTRPFRCSYTSKKLWESSAGGVDAWCAAYWCNIKIKTGCSRT